MSSVPKNKEELIHAIEQAFDNIQADYLGIPERYTRKLGIEGNVKNTEISVCDTLSYLIGWGELVLKWHERKSNGQSVDFPETGYKWNELGKLAQYFQEQRKNYSYEHLLFEFREATIKIIQLVKSLDDQALYGCTWYKGYTLGKMIQFNTSSPMKNMRTKVRRFKKTHEL